MKFQVSLSEGKITQVVLETDSGCSCDPSRQLAAAKDMFAAILAAVNDPERIDALSARLDAANKKLAGIVEANPAPTT